MTKYKSCRFVDGKIRWIVVDENGNIINRSPSKDELKDLRKEFYLGKNKDRRSESKKQFTVSELLDYLKQFEKENRRIPVRNDFQNNPCYPSYTTYKVYFGSWSNVLKLVGFDTDSMIRNKIVETTNQKARLAEIKVINHFKKQPVDLAGENRNSPCDGICPNGKFYEVKGSRLHYLESRYAFCTKNKFKDKIEIYYFLGFNEDYTKLNYVWRVPGDIVESDSFYVFTNPWSRAKFTIGNMKEFDITEKMKEVLTDI